MGVAGVSSPAGCCRGQRRGGRGCLGDVDEEGLWGTDGQGIAS